MISITTFVTVALPTPNVASTHSRVISSGSSVGAHAMRPKPYVFAALIGWCVHVASLPRFETAAMPVQRGRLLYGAGRSFPPTTSAMVVPSVLTSISELDDDV